MEQNKELIEKYSVVIAEFMGYEFIDESIGYDNYGWWIKDKYHKEINALRNPYFLCMSNNGLKYHSSWDWLMPVVEKIESLNYEFIIFRTTANINRGESQEFPYYQGETKKEAAYKAVVEFIKWYNQNKQK